MVYPLPNDCLLLANDIAFGRDDAIIFKGVNLSLDEGELVHITGLYSAISFSTLNIL